MTTVLLGPAPCASCGTPVTVVRRPVLVWCSELCAACRAQAGTTHPRGIETALSEVVTVDPGGIVHACLARSRAA